MGRHARGRKHSGAAVTEGAFAEGNSNPRRATRERKMSVVQARPGAPNALPSPPSAGREASGQADRANLLDTPRPRICEEPHVRAAGGDLDPLLRVRGAHEVASNVDTQDEHTTTKDLVTYPVNEAGFLGLLESPGVASFHGLRRKSAVRRKANVRACRGFPRTRLDGLKGPPKDALPQFRVSAGEQVPQTSQRPPSFQSLSGRPALL